MSARQRVTSVVVVLIAATVGLGATTGSATAVPVPGELALSNADGPGARLTGTNDSVLAAAARQPCDDRATRYRLRVVAATATDPTLQADIDPWVDRTLLGPATAGLPGPLDVTAADTWQGLADAFELQIVPGTYEFALQCTDSTGTQVLEEFQGDTVTFSTPTEWMVNEVPAPPSLVTPGPTTPQPSPTPPPLPPSPSTPTPPGDDVATAGPVAPPGERVTTLTVTSAAPTAGALVTLDGRVSDGAGAVALDGSCDYVDGSTVLATVPLMADGSCSTSRSFAAGTHDLFLQFVPEAASVPGSDSPVVTVTVLAADGGDAAAEPLDPQAVQVVVPVGQIVISTPYTPDSPLSLGAATLNLEGTAFSASARFDTVTVIDSRAGNPGWTASIDREDFSNGAGGVIPALNSGFENVAAVYLPGNAIQALTVSDVPANALSADPEPIAVAAPGAGTGAVDIVGDLVLRGVPTSTPPGLYTATVVFTVG